MARWDSHAVDGTLGDVFDLGDGLDVVVGVADAPEDPETEGQGEEEEGPGNEKFGEVSSLGNK